MRYQLAAILLTLTVFASTAFAQQPCVINGYIKKNDLTPAAEHILRVNATVPLGPVSGLYSAAAVADTSDALGYIELTVTRNSVIYLSCDPRRPVRGIPTTPPGIALTVPDAPTHQLALLLPPTAVPQGYIVAIPALSNYGDSIRVADSVAQLALTLAVEKMEALRNSDGVSRLWIDPINGDDSSDGNGYFNAIKTLPRAAQLLPYNGNLAETPSIVFCPGTYPDGFNWDISGTGTMSLEVIDSLEFDAYMRSSTKSSWWGVPTIVLQDALARGIDTTGWNPFTQSPAYIESQFRLADINRTMNVSFITHYHTGGDWDGWATPAGRMTFRGNGFLVLECNWIYGQRSHITFDLTTSTQGFGAGLWINGGLFGGMAFLQDSTRATVTSPVALQLTSQMFGTYNDIPMINTPGSSKFYFKNVRRVAAFYNNWNWRANFAPSMFWRHAFNANYTANWKYENPSVMRGEIYLDEKYSGIVFHDSTKTTVINGSKGIVAVSHNRGNSAELLFTNLNTTHVEAARVSVRAPSTRKYSGNFGGHLWIDPDSTAFIGTGQFVTIRDTSTSKNANGQRVAGTVIVGVGDSIRVTVAGVLPTDVITVAYTGGTTTPTIYPRSNVFALNTLTLYGDSGRNLSYIRIRK
jgi:hypothetical protein